MRWRKTCSVGPVLLDRPSFWTGRPFGPADHLDRPTIWTGRPSIARWRITFREALPRLVHIPLKHEQAIGVAVGIGEVVLLPFTNLDFQVLVLIVDDELLEIGERGSEAIVLVVGVIPKPLRRRDQLSLARSHAVLVDHGQRRVELHFPEANGNSSWSRFDVNRLSDAIESLGGHVQRVRPR